MAGQAVKHKVNIGLTSLILIFIILCLATFSLLSLSSARGDQSLAVRSAQAVTEYYRADAQGEKWLKQADAILHKETIGVMSQDFTSYLFSFPVRDRSMCSACPRSMEMSVLMYPVFSSTLQPSSKATFPARVFISSWDITPMVSFCKMASACFNHFSPCASAR